MIGGLFMSGRMTWKEIQKKYPKQFVYLTDVELENGNAVKSGIVVHATTNPSDDFAVKAIRGEVIEEYTAPDTTLLAGVLSL